MIIYQPTVSGSLTISGSISATNGFTGSFSGDGTALTGVGGGISQGKVVAIATGLSNLF